jgi:arylsulfatase A-like enzyme/tetratricopeptide (TPR) repeat protein
VPDDSIQRPVSSPSRDCLGRLQAGSFLALVVAWSSLCVAGCGRGSHPTFPGAPVVLVSIDTLRADHLPAYGHAGVSTPEIDALRRDGILFENAYAHCPLTLPSHASVLTGLLPPEHGVRDNLGYRLDAAAHPTLARILKGRGYATGAAVSAYVLRGGTGLGDSFDFYDDSVPAGQAGAALGEVQRAGEETADRLLGWRETLPRGRPPFLFLHLFEPHAPYEPPPAFAGRAASAYDGEIAAASAAVGRFLDRLRKDGTYDRAIVVLFSDHGEGLMEHGERHHGILLYRWALHVPLILKLPGSARAGESVGSPVGLVDILPTLARLLAVDVPAGLPGRSLLETNGPPRPQFAETYYPRLHLGWSELRSLVDDRHQLVDGPRPELYDIRQDPRELHDRASSDAGRTRSMKDLLDRHPARFAGPGAVAAADRERLQALGYLGAAAPGDGPLPNPRDHVGEVEEIEAAFRLTKTSDAQAVVAFRRLLARHPRLLDVQLGLAEALARLERYDEAAAAYAAVLSLAPSMRSEVGTRLARVSLLLGRMDDVETHARSGLEASPAEARELLAWAALHRGDLDSAEREARAALDHAPGAAGAALALAEVHVRRSDLEAALALLDETRSRARAPVRGLQLARGDVLARLGRHREAAAALREEIQAFPQNSVAYARLAIVHAIQGRTRAEVARLLEAMLAASPGAQTADLAAQTLRAIGDSSEAARWRKRAAALRVSERSAGAKPGGS